MAKGPPKLVAFDHDDYHARRRLLRSSDDRARLLHPEAFPEQIQQLGLEPWQIGKWYTPVDNSTAAQVRLDLTAPRARLQTTFRPRRRRARLRLRARRCRC